MQCLELLAILFFGALSDRVGRRPCLSLEAIVTAVFAYPLFWAIYTGSMAAIGGHRDRVCAVARGHERTAGGVPVGAVRRSRALQRRVARGAAGVRLRRRAGAAHRDGAPPCGLPGRGDCPYVIGLALVTIVSVVLATETHRDDIN